MSACGWRRPLPLRACGPRVLRWKTLRVSSAPHPGGFESHEMGANKTVPLRGPFPIQWWAMRDVACGFAARSRFGPAALACCAGKRLRVSSAPHPVGFESHALGPKKKGSHCWEPIKSVVGDEGCRVRLTPPAFASGLRPSRAALENASRFLSSAPFRVRIPCAGPKQKRSPCEDRFQFNGGR